MSRAGRAANAQADQGPTLASPAGSDRRSAKLLGVRFAVSVLASIAVLGITACGAQRSAGCAPPLGPSGGRLIPDGARMTLAAGTIVYVALVEAGDYLNGHYPNGFPWLSATSSRPNMLVLTPMCSRGGAYSLPVRLWAFRATHTGKATLTAQLTPAWRSVKGGPRPYQSTVTIRG
jgi:hypothetical protein